MKDNKKNIFSRVKNTIVRIETIEEKSFWIIGPLIALFGLISLCTVGFYESMVSPIALAILCLIIPGFLMIWVAKKKKYHIAYPILCILMGAISMPFMFITSGGFLSGMPIFLTATTAITALCYDRKWRITSLALCLFGSTLSLIYVYNFNPDYHIIGSESLFQNISNINALHFVYDDILLGYYLTSIGLYLSISFVIVDVRKYKLNQEMLQKYFDIQKRNEIFKQVLNKEDETNKTDHKNACILFADISNFTPITEKMSGDDVSELLNIFFTTAGRYIHETGGIIDKYIGDCIMAYWLDSEDEDCVLKAVKAMLNTKLDIYSQSEKIFERFGCELNFSVGIAYGDVIFGDIGSDTMHDYTVIGDAVNSASRIQGYAVSGEMLIGDLAAERIKKSIILENVEINHYFKGKNKPIDLYRIIGLSNEKQEITLNDKIDYGYKLNVCGCRGSFPVSGLRFHEYGGETSCYVFKKDDYALIVDCGTGLKNAIPIIQKCKKIDILLTHVHYDHILGFLMTKFPKESDVKIYGNFSAWDGGKTLEKFMQHPYWPVELITSNKIDIKVGEEIKINDDFTAVFHLSDHPDNGCVIELRCNEKKIAFLADCENAEKLDESISKDADIIFFDGMFDDNDKISHKGWGHGTWQDGVRFLRTHNVKRLIITHHNPELGDRSLMEKEEEARKLDQRISFAKTGDIYNI